MILPLANDIKWIKRYFNISSKKKIYIFCYSCIQCCIVRISNCGFFFFLEEGGGRKVDVEKITNNLNQRQESRKDNNVEHMAHENLASILSPWILWKKKKKRKKPFTRGLFKNFPTTWFPDNNQNFRMNAFFERDLESLWEKKNKNFQFSYFY